MAAPAMSGDAGDVSTYEPGIDGLRAVAVVAVMLFHGGFAWAAGGFLGVSLFFTLSGFLITRLLLDEADRTGRVRLGRFLARRVRRLAPASLVCLVLIAAGATLFAASGRPLQVRGDLLAALGYVANWRFLLSHQSYADLFLGGPSPVLHFWSLAIEEQFYLVYPALIAAAAALGRRLRRGWTTRAMVLGLAALAIGLALANTDHDRGYYATHLRAAELLIGGVAAMVVGRFGVGGAMRRPRRWSLAGSIAAAGFVVGVVMVAQSSIWLTAGGFTALAVVWSIMIAGVLVPGPLRRLLSLAPVVHVGRLSFSLYLYHWPVFLLLTPSRVGVGGVALFVLRVATSFVAASLSYHLVEHPIRVRRVRLAAWRGGVAYALVAAAVLAVAVVQLPAGQPSTFAALVDAPEGAVVFTPAVESSVPSTIAPKALVVAVVGSDTSVLEQVRHEADASGAELVDLVDPGCSALQPQHPCPLPSERVERYLAEGGRPDVVVVGLGEADHAWVVARLMAATAAREQAVLDEYPRIETDLGFVRAVRRAVPVEIAVQVVDAAPLVPDVADPLPSLLAEAVLGSVNTVAVQLADIGPGTYASAPSAEGSDAPARVMVLGDSASYGVAVDLHEVAGDRLEVMWAGRKNCPLAAAVEIRWWPGAEWTIADCRAKQAEWPGLIDQFRPDVVLVVLTLTEASEQRYAGDEAWYTAGDARFAAEHEAAMERLLADTERDGTLVLVADTYQIGMPGRADAWNAFVATWPQRWPRVGVVEFGAPVAAAQAASGHSLLPDDIHLDPVTLKLMVTTVFLPAIDEALARLADQPTR